MLEAGRELDVLVAKHVIGLDCYGVELYQHDEFCELHNPPRYSTDMAAAWEVVVKMGDRGLHLTLIEQPTLLHWEAGFAPNDEGARHCGQLGKTVPLAICLAALKAVGYEPKESA